MRNGVLPGHRRGAGREASIRERILCRVTRVLARRIELT
jgi:hypothetical protein